MACPAPKKRRVQPVAPANRIRRILRNAMARAGGKGLSPDDRFRTKTAIVPVGHKPEDFADVTSRTAEQRLSARTQKVRAQASKIPTSRWPHISNIEGEDCRRCEKSRIYPTLLARRINHAGSGSKVHELDRPCLSRDRPVPVGNQASKQRKTPVVAHRGFPPDREAIRSCAARGCRPTRCRWSRRPASPADRRWG